MSIDNGATCMVAAESSFGSTDATDARALADATIGGLTAYSLRCTKDSWGSAAGALKQRTFDRNDITLQGGRSPLQVAAAIASGGPVVSIQGEIPLTFEARGFGSTAPLSTALGLLLASGLAHTLRTPGTSCTATEATANTFTVGGGDAGKFAAGDVISVSQTDGTCRFCYVTQVSGTTITTLEPHGIPDTETALVRQCHMFWAPTDNEADGSSLVVQLAPKDAEHTLVCVGARLAKVGISVNENTGVDIACTVRVPDGEYRDAVVITPTKPLPIGGTGSTGLRTRVSPVLVTADVSASSAPVTATAAAFPVRTWSAEIDIGLIPTDDPATRSGLSGMRVSDASLSGSVTQSAPTSGADFREVVRLSEKRAATFTAAGANAAGNGMCVWAGAVEPSEDPGVTFAERDRTQVIPFRAGDHAHATGATAYLNRPWILAFTA